MSDSPAALTREDADRTLDGLRAAHARISAAMFAIDTHRGHDLLRGGELSGAAREAWAALRPTIEALWAQFGTWRELLGRAEEVRARRQRPQDADMAELEVLLCEPVVGLDHRGAPAAGAPPVARVTVADLGSRLAESSESVIGLLDQVAAAHSAAARRLAEAEIALYEARELADALNADAVDAGAVGEQLAALGARLAALASEVRTDPLGGADTGPTGCLDAVTAELGVVRARLREAQRFRDTHVRRLAELRAAVSQLAELEEQVTRACRTTTVKIAVPGLPAPRRASAELRGRVAELEATAEAGRWTLAQRLAAELTRAVAQEQARSQDLHQAAAGLLDRREELRGRLRAYQAKAARIGVAEDPEVSLRHARARELLWTSPCDLRAAAVAVRAYQESVARSATDRRGRSE